MEPVYETFNEVLDAMREAEETGVWSDKVMDGMNEMAAHLGQDFDTSEELARILDKEGL